MNVKILLYIKLGQCQILVCKNKNRHAISVASWWKYAECLLAAYVNILVNVVDAVVLACGCTGWAKKNSHRFSFSFFPPFILPL